MFPSAGQSINRTHPTRLKSKKAGHYGLPKQWAFGVCVFEAFIVNIDCFAHLLKHSYLSETGVLTAVFVYKVECGGSIQLDHRRKT